MLQELKDQIGSFVGKYNIRDFSASLKSQHAKDALSKINSKASVDDYDIRTLAGELNSEILKNVGVSPADVNAFLRMRNKAGVKPTNIPTASATWDKSRKATASADIALAQDESVQLIKLSNALYEGHVSIPECEDVASLAVVTELIEGDGTKEETYRVYNDHHDIRTNVKATSAKHAREKAAEQDKRYEHRDTTAEKSWTKESVDEAAVLFTDEQIEKLRTQYNGVQSMDTTHLPKIHALFDSLSPEALKQLGEANIKFISPLAQNAAKRGAKPVKEAVEPEAPQVDEAHTFIQQELAHRDINVKRVQKHPSKDHHQIVVDKDDITHASATVRRHGLDKEYSVVGE